ncbi:unnamed protein product, partial [Lymnaea stagnalis]
MKSSVLSKTMSTMKLHLDALFIILISLDRFSLSGSQPPCVTPRLKSQGELCKASYECASSLCSNTVCTCPGSTYFESCTQSCVNNCNSTVKAVTAGHIVRLRQTNTYQHSQFCTWTIDAPAGTFIFFRITYLDLTNSDNCSTDSLVVYDDQELRLRDCQSIEIDAKVIASGSRKLNITYKKSSPSYGLIASYYLYTHNSVTRDRFGYIASPRYPQKYPPNYVVSWTIDGGEEVVT